MGWVRIDDSFYDNGKFDKVGPLGIACWVVGLAYANRNLTDGFIPTRQARKLIDCDGLGVYEGAMAGRDAEPMDGVSDLVDACLWDEVDGGYQIHDYLDYQPSADQVRAQREKNAIRQRSWRDNRGSNPASNGVTDSVIDIVTGEVSDGPVTGAPNPNTQPPTSTSLRGDRNETLRASDATQPSPTRTRCTRHPAGNPGNEPCDGCRRDRALDDRRAARDAEKRARALEAARLACTRCDGNWITNPDGSPSRRKCGHGAQDKAATG